MSNKINRDYYETPKAGSIMRKLWKIAGGDRYLLERATYTDQIKYMCLGGIILATGVLAGLAGGYAFYTIFSSKGEDSLSNESIQLSTLFLSVVFGTIWGLIIFNIDRFIVTSTGKGDGTEAITWGEFKSAIPRIIMGAIIAITISKPVEIRMFKSEIEAGIKTKQERLRTEYENDTRNNFTDRISDIEKERGLLQKPIDAHIANIAVKDSLYNVETSSGQGGRIKGEGPVAIALKAERTRLEVIKNEYIVNHKNELDNIEKRRQKLYAQLETELKKSDEYVKKYDGLLLRIKVLHEKAPIISIFIMLLFLALELTPIFFKLMLVKTPYDYMEENVKELIKAENGIEVKYDYYLYNPPPEVNSEPKTWFFGLIKRKPKEREGVQQHLVINHEAERKIYETKKATETQQRLIDKALGIYEVEMSAKIEENPEEFIISSSNQIIEQPTFNKEEELEKMNLRLEKYRLKRLEQKRREDINNEIPLDENNVKEKPEDNTSNKDDSSKDTDTEELDKDDSKDS